MLFRSKEQYSEIEGTSHVLMSFFLFFQVFLELYNTTLQITVYVNIASDNSLHPTHILIDIIFNRADTLHIRN